MLNMNIFVCENFALEYKKIISDIANDGIKLISYPCMCEKRNNKKTIKNLLDKSVEKNSKSIVLCSEYCDILKITKEIENIEVITQKYCFNHLAGDHIIEYITSKGGYLIGLGWLKTWKSRLEQLGFEKENAREFFGNSCLELVFFDAGIDKNAHEYLKELSEYLDIPYTIIEFDLEGLKYVLNNIISRWELEKIGVENKKVVIEAQTKIAEYASILDILSRLTQASNKNDAIKKMEEIYKKVMGAKEFVFDEKLKTSSNFLDEKKGCFQIALETKGKTHGNIKVSKFLFPQHINKYYNFALSISQICALVLENILHYEELLKNRELLEYENSHDSLTGLYNRNHFNKIIKKRNLEQNFAIFSFDVDKLKYVNDTYGHLEGDKLLKNISKILLKTFKKESVYRIGGDEFICLKVDTNEKLAEDLLKKLYSNIKKHNDNEKREHLKISISAGYAVSNTENKVNEILRAADFNMYADKASKREKRKT